jgi:hypothetical protein
VIIKLIILKKLQLILLVYYVKKDIFPICQEFYFKELITKAFEKLELGKIYFRYMLNIKAFAEKKH